MNVEETSNTSSGKNEELIKREEVKDTPFVKITTNGESFLVMGKHRITGKGDNETVDKVIKELKKTDWAFMLNIISAAVEMHMELKEKEILPIKL